MALLCRYEGKKSGIGFHGDKERALVVCLRAGDFSESIIYRWFHRSKPVGEPIAIPLGVGDVYFMSNKAVGQDWARSSIPTLRHATGTHHYTEYKKR